MSIRPRVLVAIPAYRCEKQIGRVLAGFTKPLVDRVDRVLVIDNRSPDQTVKAAQAAIERHGLGPKFSVVRNLENYGLGGTHKVAFHLAKKEGFDLLAIVHGDDQATTSELSSLLDEYQNHPEATAILGSRFSRGSRLVGYSKTRIFGNRVLNVIYTLLSFRKTEDLGSGLNLFKVRDFDWQELQHFSDSFTFNMDLLLSLFRHRRVVRFYPITWTELDQVSNARNFSVGWIALKTVLKWSLGGKVYRAPRSYACETA